MERRQMTVAEARLRLGISKKKMAQLIEDEVLVTSPNALDKRSKLVDVAAVERLARQGIAAGPKAKAA